MEPVKASLDRIKRFQFLMAAYPIKYYVDNQRYIYVGQGSSDIAKSFVYFTPANAPEKLGDVGPMCESGKGVRIVFGGEHRNDLVYNGTLAAFPAHKELLRREGNPEFFGNRMRGPVTIGGGVTISADVKILSGVTIGHGAVIGADAVVTKDVPPYAIVAGNPARIIRKRFSDEHIDILLKLRWWDWDLKFLRKHFALLNTTNPAELMNKLPPIESIPMQPVNKVFCFASNRSVFSGDEIQWMFVGVEINGERKLAKDLPADFNNYVNQVNAPDNTEITYLPDLFERCGL